MCYDERMDLTNVRKLAGTETGLCVISVVRADGTPHASVVNAGVLSHPVSGEEVVGFVTRGGSVKHRRLRAHAHASATFRRGWRWVGVDGPVDLIGPDDHVDGVDLPRLLRDVFVAAGGTHDDWDTYDRVMANERRLAVLVRPHRVLTPS